MLFVNEDIYVKELFRVQKPSEVLCSRNRSVATVKRVAAQPERWVVLGAREGLTAHLHLFYVPSAHEVQFGAESNGKMARGQQQVAGSCYSRTAGPVFVSWCNGLIGVRAPGMKASAAR